MKKVHYLQDPTVYYELLYPIAWVIDIPDIKDIHSEIYLN